MKMPKDGKKKYQACLINPKTTFIMSA
jgi:hypothetical protein